MCIHMCVHGCVSCDCAANGEQMIVLISHRVVYHSLHFDLCGLLSCFHYLSYGFIDSQSELLRLLKKVTKTGNIKKHLR